MSLNRIIKLEQHIFKNSYYEFFKAAFPIVAPGDDLVDNWHIQELCDILQAEADRINQKLPKHLDYIINISPRTSKSLICSGIFPVWCWLKYPTMRLITVSYSDTAASRNMLTSKTLIESKWFQDRFDLSLIKLNESDMMNNYLGYRHSYSIFSKKITGDGADMIIFDDPQDPEQANSERERGRAWDAYRFKLLNRLNNPKVGVRLIIGQRLNIEDLAGKLLQNKKNFHHICLPAKLTKDVWPPEYAMKYINGLLDPVRLDEIELEKYADPIVGLGSRGFSAQYLQNPVPDDGDIIKRDWLCSVSRIEFEEILKNNNNKVVWNFFLDSAYGRDGGDENAILQAAVIGKFMYIKNVWTNRFNFPKLIDELKRIIKEEGSVDSRLYIEPKASGVSIVDELKTRTTLNVIESKAPSVSKKERVTGITPQLEAKRIVLVDDVHEHRWCDKFVNECLSFTGKDDKFDNQVDALEIAVTKLLKTVSTKMVFLDF